MKFDQITEYLGEFGKYQKRLYFIICIPAIFTGMQMLSSVFTLAIPGHRCKVASNDTYAIENVYHERHVNSSIPYVEADDDSGKMELSECKMYVTTNQTVYAADYVPINTSQAECHSWVYDKSVFQSTFITEQDLICGKEMARSHANMILFAGVLVGAIGMGAFSDLFGRKTALLVSIIIHIGAGFGSAFSTTFAMFVIFRFFVGWSNMGIFMSCFVIGMELVGPSKRTFAGIIIEFFWCIGLFLLLLVAYFVRDWNTLYIIITAPAALLFVYFWIIPESPRWLLSRYKIDQAKKVIKRAADVNEVHLPDKVFDSLDKLEEEKGESVLKLFKSPVLIVRTLVIYFNWCVVSMVYYGLGLNVGNLGGDIYINFLVATVVEVLAYVLCLFTLNRFGRKIMHVSTMIFGGVACLCTIFTVLYGGDAEEWLTMVLSNCGKFGISAAFAVIYVWSAEIFPTPVRNSGMGSSSMMARVGGMISPYIADLGTYIHGPFGTALPLIVFGGLSVLAGLLSLILPETMGQTLPDTIEEAKKFGRHTKKGMEKKYQSFHSSNSTKDLDTFDNNAFDYDEKKLQPIFVTNPDDFHTKL